MSGLIEFRRVVLAGSAVAVAGLGCEKASVCAGQDCPSPDQQVTGAGGAANEPAPFLDAGVQSSDRQQGGLDSGRAPGDCTDGVQNGTETEVDCGGLCEACVGPTCTDGLANGDESDVDCGGSCSVRCATGASCAAADQCLSGVCTAGACVAPSCADGVANGGEPDVDCGGPCEESCETGLKCEVGADCVTSVCAASLCERESCTDAVVNGDETDVDCGGSCASDCVNGLSCDVAEDCASGVCSAGVCAVPSCTDGVLNGDETAADCGGSCGGCAVALACVVGADCQSAVCENLLCAAATCTDGVVNGTETDADCGGACGECGRAQACSSAEDCSTTGCAAGICVVGPTSTFSVSATQGQAPHALTVASEAVAGDGAIESTLFDFGDGQGFAATSAHTYVNGGSYTITLRVLDANGFSAESARSVVISAAGSVVQFSDTDRSSNVVISDDGLELEFLTFDSVGALTNASLIAGSGFFYFEVERLSDPYPFSFGVVTQNFNLSASPGEGAASVGVDLNEGSVRFNNAILGGVGNPAATTHYGFAIDYRGATPTVYVVGAGVLLATADLTTVTVPVFGYAGGLRSKVGTQLRLNSGGDTQNFPFLYNIAGILSDNGIATESLILGFGQTTSAPASEPAALDIQGAGNIPQRGAVLLTAVATDPEDGNLSGSVRWVDLATPNATRSVTVGNEFNFSSDTLGIHPIEATVTDTSGLTTRTRVDVEVTGLLPQFAPVALEEDEQSGSGVSLSADGLSARFEGAGKMGVRANQGLLNGFEYFEIHRLVGALNQGGGLAIRDGNLNPYDPIDVPPSCSVNYSASIWRNLISIASFNEVATEFYGFAVDYRGRTPIVHVLTEEAGGAPTLAHSMRLDDVTVPIYPLLYGDPVTSPVAFDAEINFGASAFHYAPASVLAAAGVDASELQVGWGNANP